MNDKRQVLETLLEQGSVLIHLDPRVDGVSVPPWLKHQPQLVLEIGYNMPVPIYDLLTGPGGVQGTLSFRRAPYPCVIPWAAMFAVVGVLSQRGMVWPESVPSEVVAEVDQNVATMRNAPKPKLKAVTGGTPRGPARRGHLRLVKGGMI